MTELSEYEKSLRESINRHESVRKRLAELRDHKVELAEFMTFSDDDQRSKEFGLIAKIKERLPELIKMLADIDNSYEDGVYRFYHGSYKVDFLRYETECLVEIVLAIAPNPAIDERFVEIAWLGTNDEETTEDTPRHIVEAFFHARYFAKMFCEYGKQADQLEASLHKLVRIIARRKVQKPPYSLFEGDSLPSGWAAVLELFNLR